MLPTCVNVPSIFVSSRLVIPSTSRLFVIVTLLVGILIIPLPLARSSKLLLESVVSIVLAST